MNFYRNNDCESASGKFCMRITSFINPILSWSRCQLGWTLFVTCIAGATAETHYPAFKFTDNYSCKRPRYKINPDIREILSDPKLEPVLPKQNGPNSDIRETWILDTSSPVPTTLLYPGYTLLLNLVGFNGISTIVGYLILNPAYIYIYYLVWLGLMAYQPL